MTNKRSLKARVTVYPRPEILDPQGKAIRQALTRLGFDQVGEVRAGKSFDLRLDTDDRKTAEAALHDMCAKLLANPVIEDYSFELEEA